VALSAFGLVLILARRLRAVTERVNMFLPVSEGTLPLPGTPVPVFEATATDGEQVNAASFAGTDRIFAVLSTGCGSCDEQLVAFRELGAGMVPRPIVTIAGAPEARARLVAALGDDTVLIEELEGGPVAGAFEIGEYPAVLLIRNGVIQHAGHDLAEALAKLPAAAGPARD
jgi:hypothetical protein